MRDGDPRGCERGFAASTSTNHSAAALSLQGCGAPRRGALTCALISPSQTHRGQGPGPAVVSGHCYCSWELCSCSFLCSFHVSLKKVCEALFIFPEADAINAVLSPRVLLVCDPLWPTSVGAASGGGSQGPRPLQPSIQAWGSPKGTCGPPGLQHPCWTGTPALALRPAGWQAFGCSFPVACGSTWDQGPCRIKNKGLFTEGGARTSARRRHTRWRALSPGSHGACCAWGTRPEVPRELPGAPWPPQTNWPDAPTPLFPAPLGVCRVPGVLPVRGRGLVHGGQPELKGAGPRSGGDIAS